MKQISLLLLAIMAIFASCDDTKKSTTIVGSNLPSEYFTIDPDADTVIRSTSGIVLRIYKNTFEYNNGGTVTGPVQVELKEATSPVDIILANLSTQTDSALLQTDGMIYVNATCKGEKLVIAGKPIGVVIPKDSLKTDMKLFEGNVTGAGIVWASPQRLFEFSSPAAASTGKTVKYDTAITECSCDSDTAMLAGTTGIEGQTPLVVDSFGQQSFIAEVNQKGLNLFIPDHRAAYVIELKKLGWANIDRLMFDSRTKEVRMITRIKDADSYSNIHIALVIGDCYIPGYQKKDGTYGFSHSDYEPQRLPVGAGAAIVVMANKNGKPVYALRKLTITEVQETDLELLAIDNETLRKTLNEQL